MIGNLQIACYDEREPVEYRLEREMIRTAPPETTVMDLRQALPWRCFAGLCWIDRQEEG